MRVIKFHPCETQVKIKVSVPAMKVEALINPKVTMQL